MQRFVITPKQSSEWREADFQKMKSALAPFVGNMVEDYGLSHVLAMVEAAIEEIQLEG